MRLLISFAILLIATCSADAATGFHATLKVDFALYWAARLDGAEILLKERLDRVHANYSELKIENARLSVRVPDAATRATAKKLLQRRFSIVGGFIVDEIDQDLVASPETVYRRQTEHELLVQTAQAVERATSAVAGRAAYAEVVVPNRIELTLPGLADRAKIDTLFGPPATVAFYLVDEKADAKPTASPPAGDIVLPYDNGPRPQFLAVQAEPFMSGERITSAQTSISDVVNTPSILLRFDEAGTALLARVTGENPSGRLAIAIDGRIVCAPMIAERIPRGQVEMIVPFTQEKALELAERLSPSGLPAPVRLIESGVGPTP